MLGARSSPSTLLLFVLSLTPPSLLTGCTLATTAPDSPIAGTAMQGKVYGGNQPVMGAHVYLIAATVSGVGSAGYGLASTSLLSSTLTGHSDATGAYVLTDSNGNFSLNSTGPTYFYTCPSATTQVYLYAQGGNPGSGTNNAASFMAALGNCGNLSSSTSVWVNELTTVAAAYALAGFATDALHISIPKYASSTQQTNSITDALALTGLQNAFATAANLASTTTGNAVTSTGNGTPTSGQVITLGNILAACVNSNGATTNPSNCYTLLNNAGSTGGATGTLPSETATAAINIAHHPYVSATVLSNLFGLQAASGAPFTNGDSSQPIDFTVAIKFTGGGLSEPLGIAIDGSGNAWVANKSNNSVSEFSSTGSAVSGSSGYTGGGLSSPEFIAIDGSGYAWVTNNANSSISKFSSTGSTVSGSPYTGGGYINQPMVIAIDGSGNAWVANYGNNSVSELSSTGSAVNGVPYTGGGLNQPQGIAIDGSGNVWVANAGNISVSKFSSTGSVASGSPYLGGGTGSAPEFIAIDGSGNAWVIEAAYNGLGVLSGSTGVAADGGSGGGLNEPFGIAIDGSGNVWVTNYGYGASSVSEFSSSGTALSGSSGYTGGGSIGGGFYQPVGIAIDGSGNAWVTDSGVNVLTELVGAATPVVTPLAASLAAPYKVPASKP